MPVQTRSQTANATTTATTAEESVQVPLTREQKKHLREEMKKKEREDRQRAWSKKNSDVHKALRERTQLIIDNGYVNSPIFEFLREAKQNCADFETMMIWYIIFGMEHCHPRGSINLSYIARTCLVPPDKHQNVCNLFHKFISLVGEEVTWIEHNGDTIAIWNNTHEMFIKHFDIIFRRWNFYKHHFAHFPDCIEF